MKILHRILCACFCVCLFSAPAFAAEQGVKTTITSQKTVYDQSGSKVVFSGSVKVVRPDMTIWSDNMTVFLKPTDKKAAATSGPQAGAVSKIVAVGNVRLVREGKKGFCGKAVYNADESLVTMTVKPRLEDGDNSIAGKTIKLWLTDNRSEVVGGNEPVEAIFFTPKEGKK